MVGLDIGQFDPTVLRDAAGMKLCRKRFRWMNKS
jgi:hypothetical protein